MAGQSTLGGTPLEEALTSQNALSSNMTRVTVGSGDEAEQVVVGVGQDHEVGVGRILPLHSPGAKPQEPFHPVMQVGAGAVQP